MCNAVKPWRCTCCAYALFYFPGTPAAGVDGWEIKRAPGVEAALAGAALSPHTLAAALEALPADTRPEPPAAEFVDAAAQGILLEALAPLVQQVSPPSGYRRVLSCVKHPAAMSAGAITHEHKPAGQQLQCHVWTRTGEVSRMLFRCCFQQPLTLLRAEVIHCTSPC